MEIKDYVKQFRDLQGDGVTMCAIGKVTTDR